jgi:hypothetical protein
MSEHTILDVIEEALDTPQWAAVIGSPHATVGHVRLNLTESKQCLDHPRAVARDEIRLALVTYHEKVLSEIKTHSAKLSKLLERQGS